MLIGIARNLAGNRGDHISCAPSMVSHNWSLIFIGMKQTKKNFEWKIGELCFSEFLNCFLTKLSGIDLHENLVD